MSTTSAVLEHLRALLRSRRLSYGEVAQRMGLSEVTLKRLFSGRTALSLQRLDDLCRALGISPAEALRKVAAGPEPPKAQLSWEQEKALARDLGLFKIFSALLKGRRLQAEVLPGMEAEDQARHLQRLTRLGLLRLGPQGPQVLVERRYQWLPGGPLAQRYGPVLRADFLDAPFDQPGEATHFLSLVLSERSKKVALQMERRFIQDLQRLSKEDLLADPQVEGTLTVLTALRTWTPSMFLPDPGTAPPDPGGTGARTSGPSRTRKPRSPGRPAAGG